MLRQTARFVALLATAAIIFVTLSPIGLRPETGHPDLERFAAFALLGACLSIAYPGRRGVMVAVLVAGAGTLEAAQLMVPGRDAHLHDAIIKAIGGVAGLAVTAWAEATLVRIWRSRQKAGEAR